MKIILIITLLVVGVNGLNAQPLGFSGMEKIGDSNYLVVIDKKNYQDGARLAILKVDESNGYSIEKLKVKNWKHDQGRSNDLESVCSVPGAKDEFLLVESGYWEGDYGRIFHIRLEDEKVKVKNVYQVPSISPAGKKNPEGDNFEGVACVKKKNTIYILLGERGGTTLNPNGLLRIGILKKGKEKVDWKTYGDEAIVVKAPKSKKDKRVIRSITDLHMSKEGVLYASAAVDSGDMGPFSSIVYKVGQVYFENHKVKLALSKNRKPLYVVDGFKIEALSSAPLDMPDCKFSIGTEDESYPGQWRPLFSVN